MQNLNYHLNKATPNFIWAIALGTVASFGYAIAVSSIARGVSVFLGVMVVSYILYLLKAIHSFLNDLSETKARSEWEQSLLRTHQLMAATAPEKDFTFDVTFSQKRDELFREGCKRGWITDVGAGN